MNKARTAVVLSGIALIPLIYAGSLIWSNQDPLHHLDQIPAAIVNEDVPATSPTASGRKPEPRRRPRGHAHEDDKNNDFAWAELDADAAAGMLASGDVLVVLTVPSDFSADAMSVAGDEPTAAKLTIRTNDAANQIVGNIASTVGAEVTAALSSSVSSTYLDSIYVGFTDIHSQISDAAAGAPNCRRDRRRVDRQHPARRRAGRPRGRHLADERGCLEPAVRCGERGGGRRPGRRGSVRHRRRHHRRARRRARAPVRRNRAQRRDDGCRGRRCCRRFGPAGTGGWLREHDRRAAACRDRSARGILRRSRPAPPPSRAAPPRSRRRPAGSSAAPLPAPALRRSSKITRTRLRRRGLATGLGTLSAGATDLATGASVVSDGRRMPRPARRRSPPVWRSCRPDRRASPTVSRQGRRRSRPTPPLKRTR